MLYFYGRNITVSNITRKELLAALEVIAIRDMPDDPEKSAAAIEWLKKKQSEITDAIRDIESGVKKKKIARAVCYDLANIVMEDWFRYYFK